MSHPLRLCLAASLAWASLAHASCSLAQAPPDPPDSASPSPLGAAPTPPSAQPSPPAAPDPTTAPDTAAEPEPTAEPAPDPLFLYDPVALGRSSFWLLRLPSDRRAPPDPTGFARERLPVLAEPPPAEPDAPPPAALDAPPIRFRVLVEQGLEPDADAFARTVEEVLLSPNGWAAAGASFVWVEQDFDITVLLASPKTTDTLCKPFDTGGKLSCANGLRANLNHWRWTHGADSWPDDLAGYRRYLVSHEVGHLLGMRHQGCPKAGDPVPIMMQQSKGVGDCKPNHEPVALELKLMRAQQEARRKLALKAAPKPSKAHKPIPLPNIQGP